MRIAPLVLFAAFAVACSSSTDATNGYNPPGGSPLPAAGSITLQAASFNPATLTISRTGTVTFNNTSSITHNVMFDVKTGSPANIADHTSGSNAVAFGTAGNFPFHCSHHAGMTGTITVQ